MTNCQVSSKNNVCYYQSDVTGVGMLGRVEKSRCRETTLFVVVGNGISIG